jgi:hypothetical protein
MRRKREIKKRAPAVNLKPHSRAWFDALSAFNARQAAHTRQIVQMAGHIDVCSVCGDEPASDYHLDGHHLPRNAVRTLRLCEVCLGIRQAQGEPFVLLPQRPTHSWEQARAAQEREIPTRDLHDERRAAERRWAKREKQLHRVIDSTARMYGDLQGVLGSSMESIPALGTDPDVDPACKSRARISTVSIAAPL